MITEPDPSFLFVHALKHTPNEQRSRICQTFPAFKIKYWKRLQIKQQSSHTRQKKSGPANMGAAVWKHFITNS